MLAYTNAPKIIPTHRDRWGDVKVEQVPKIDHRTLVVPGHNIRTYRYTARIEDWSYVDPDIFDIVFVTENHHFVYPDRAVTILDTGDWYGRCREINYFKTL